MLWVASSLASLRTTLPAIPSPLRRLVADVWTGAESESVLWLTGSWIESERLSLPPDPSSTVSNTVTSSPAHPGKFRLTLASVLTDEPPSSGLASMVHREDVIGPVEQDDSSFRLQEPPGKVPVKHARTGDDGTGSSGGFGSDEFGSDGFGSEASGSVGFDGEGVPGTSGGTGAEGGGGRQWG